MEHLHTLEGGDDPRVVTLMIHFQRVYNIPVEIDVHAAVNAELIHYTLSTNVDNPDLLSWVLKTSRAIFNIQKDPDSIDFEDLL